MQGSYTYPQPQDVAHPDSLALLTQLQMHGVIVTADRSTGTITLQRPAQPQVSTRNIILGLTPSKVLYRQFATAFCWQAPRVLLYKQCMCNVSQFMVDCIPV